VKVAVVGCGFAGGAFSKRFCEGKKDIFTIGYSNTTGAISKGAIDQLHLNSLIHDDYKIYNIRSIKLSVGEHSATKYFSQDVAYILDTKGLIKSLVEGENVVDRRIGVEDIPEMLSKYDYIISASGVFSPINKYLNIPTPSGDDLHVGIQMDVKTNLWEASKHEDVEIYFNKLAPKGYMWCFRIGLNTFRAGFGVPSYLKINLVDRLKLILNKLFFYSYTPQSKPFGGYIYTAKPLKKMIYDKFILTGDSLHFCDPLTGGGIAYALASGRDAASYLKRGKIEDFDSIRRMLNKRYMLKRILLQLDENKMAAIIDPLISAVSGPISPLSATKLGVKLFRSLLK
jgi:flavin-dependent dehydrogenase